MQCFVRLTSLTKWYSTKLLILVHRFKSCMKLGKPKSGICSHSTLSNMEELAQLVEHLMLLCQMFHSNIGGRQSYFGMWNQWSQVRVLYSSLNAVQCTLDFHQFDCNGYSIYKSGGFSYCIFYNMGMQLNKFILLYLFSGKAVVFVRVTSVIALVFGTKVYWFESNHPHKIEVGVCSGYFIRHINTILNLTPQMQQTDSVVFNTYKNNIPLQCVPPLRATVEILQPFCLIIF